MSKKILILFAHPTLERSRVQLAWLKAVSELPGVYLHDLYERYPDFNIEVSTEQEILLKYDIIVLQHPLYWYSAPPLMKQYIDLVLEHGWAYGRGGTALEGKTIFNALSIGGPQEEYSRTGIHKHNLLEFLLPFKQTAELCHMSYLPPFVFYGSNTATAQEITTGALHYRKTLQTLLAPDFQVDQALSATYLNHLISIPLL